jgi:hypothetical protein
VHACAAVCVYLYAHVQQNSTYIMYLMQATALIARTKYKRTADYTGYFLYSKAIENKREVFLPIH